MSHFASAAPSSWAASAVVIIVISTGYSRACLPTGGDRRLGTKPEPALFGKGAKQRALIEMWNRRLELGLLACVAQAFRHLHPAAAQLEVPQVPAWGEANKPKAQEILRILDEELGKRRFIAGDEYSVADITALVAVDFTKPARVERPPGLDNLARWHQEVSARTSAKA